MNPIQPFDLKRMFLGDLSLLFLLEIAIRTTILYLYALLILRLIGKRGMGNLSAFDFVIIIALGSAVGDPMFYGDVPLIYGMMVITVVVLLQRAVAHAVRRNDWVGEFVEGKAVRVVDRGRLDLLGMGDERISPDELFATLRHGGVRQLGEVKAAYLETTGELSIFAYDEPEKKPGLPLIPPQGLANLATYEAGNAVSEPGFYACRHCGQTVEFQGSVAFTLCPNCQHAQWTDATRDPLQEFDNRG